MLSHLQLWFGGFDAVVRWLLAPLALIFVLSGVDDLAVDAAWLFATIRSAIRKRQLAGAVQIAESKPLRVAILVPLWREHEVIGRMLEHNIASIRYPDYHFFVGAYPNDQLTQDAVRAASDRFPNVHLAICPHDGPTSKGDCLNWIYQHLSLYEERHAVRFEIVVTHDAEDLIHPEELACIHSYAARYDFVQIPVLALETPFWNLTHGVYCDEFAENHSRDMVVRSEFGCFVPGAGVGTGYRRDALAKLAEASSNRVFEPLALTEDYENGLRLHRLGCSQVFVPLARHHAFAAGRGDAGFIATREYFPRRFRAALRQRTRWVTGICLQGWERFGWKGRAREVYWLWRDRKGLIGSPLGLIANTVFAYGLATSIWTRVPPIDARLALSTLALQVFRIAVRMACAGRVYGPLFAIGVPIRAIYANALNASATVWAIARFAVAKARGRPLVWIKTDHAYPSRATLLDHRRKLGEILAGSGYLSDEAVAAGLATCPAGVRLGEHLIAQGLLDERALYEALSLQQGLPVAHVSSSEVPARLARLLPARVTHKWRVLPFRIAEGALFVASPEIPPPNMHEALRTFTSLEIRFHLITPSEFHRAATVLY